MTLIAWIKKGDICYASCMEVLDTNKVQLITPSGGYHFHLPPKYLKGIEYSSYDTLSTTAAAPEPNWMENF
ncbi:hypothetical protein N7491_003420 [Penicillium cf. griseofulvum]|uniref:Uncharacterized protein n=1 Tax=Penicillium cf. griseofulvum TaxID=2972120 RepID=A0A9W9T1N0_9EURO|nr:hypothetical protein N7472_002404 [Penicillium cf. griseofulvum]KAJ5441014.1 hypothetical protein N7491_003420 [Penicillium cf. griseofulvum]